MIFAGIDVDIITHEKALASGPEAFGLWAWGMCWTQKHTTDGRLPRIAVLSALNGRRNIMLAKRLVASGLWLDREDGGWDVWNYGKKNQTAADIIAKRNEQRSRNSFNQKLSRERRHSLSPTLSPVTSPPVTGSQSPLQLQPPLQPDQIISDAARLAPPNEPTTGVRLRGSRLSSDWVPKLEDQAYAKARGITDPLGDFLVDFREYWGALPGARGVKLDWDATFRSRVRQVQSRPSAGRGVPRQQIGGAASATWMNPTENFDFASGDK